MLKKMTQEQKTLVDDYIKITEFKEQEDGSAVIQCEMSDFVKSVLIEKGIITLIKEQIDSLDHTEHLTGPKVEADVQNIPEVT